LHYHAAQSVTSSPGTREKFARLERHQRGAAAARLRRDQGVVRADRRAFTFQMRANVAGMRGIFGVERKDVDAETEKSLQQLLAQLAPVAALDPVAHLEKHQHRQREFWGRRAPVLPPCVEARQCAR
jgi:hypothetical protein